MRELDYGTDKNFTLSRFMQKTGFRCCVHRKNRSTKENPKARLDLAVSFLC